MILPNVCIVFVVVFLMSSRQAQQPGIPTIQLTKPAIILNVVWSYPT